MTTSDEGGSSGDDSAGFLTPPDGGTVAPGTCYGTTQFGHLSTVHSTSAESPEPACHPDPLGCDSDPVGDWTVVSHCGLDHLPNFFAQDCPDSTMEVLDSTVEGTRTFGADFGFAEALSISVDATLAIDTMACYGLGCEDFGDAVDMQAELSMACIDDDAGGCDCALSIHDVADRTGTWEVTDEGLVITTVGVPGSPIPLCVEGDRLVMWDPLTETRAYPSAGCESSQDCEAAFARDPEHAGTQWFCDYG